MREELEILVEELRKLKAEGLSSVLLEPDTLDLLQEQIQSAASHLEKSDSPGAPGKTPDQAQSTAAKEPTQDAKAKRVILPAGTKAERWQWLREKVISCPHCNRHVPPGKRVVFGVGNLDADVFFCGEAPGAEEEIQGEPFVGPAGLLLTQILRAMGLSREEVYISNILNWRPATDTPYGNRPPTPEEMEWCLPYLQAQLEIVQPKVIVALGATAVNGLLGYDSKRAITRCRGQWHSFADIPTLITFHPSYVLRNETKAVKRQIWEDMLHVMEKLGMPISTKQKGYFL